LGDEDANGTTIRLSSSRKKKVAVDAATPDLTQAQREILYEEFGISETVWKEDTGAYTTVRGWRPTDVLRKMDGARAARPTDILRER